MLRVNIGIDLDNVALRILEEHGVMRPILVGWRLNHVDAACRHSPLNQINIRGWDTNPQLNIHGTIVGPAKARPQPALVVFDLKPKKISLELRHPVEIIT